MATNPLYINKSSIQTSRPRSNRRKQQMKLTFKQRLRNWLNSDDSEAKLASQVVETSSLQSDGMRFQLYKAAGGYVIETATYDHVKDRRHTKMYVITDDKDIGQELGKIITMESLRV